MGMVFAALAGVALGYAVRGFINRKLKEANALLEKEVADLKAKVKL